MYHSKEPLCKCLYEIRNRGNISEDSENQVLNIFPEFKFSNCLKLKVEKAAEELQEAERQEVEAQREAVALQEQIEKMIQVLSYEAMYCITMVRN